MKHLALAALAALSLGLVACGDDDDSGGSSSEPQAASVTFSGDGKDTKVTGPGDLNPGPVEITVKNSGKKGHGLLLIRIDGDHTAAELSKVGDAWGDKGKPLPGWVHLDGGVVSVEPGAAVKTNEDLEEGRYLAFDIDNDASAEFEVAGDAAGGELPTTTATIEASEYKFETSGLKAGNQRVTFANKGKQPHFAVSARIKGNATIEDVRKAIQGDGGEPPIEDDASSTSGLIDGGKTQVVDMTLKKGRYALLCFIPDRQGGPPHAVKGMVSEVEVQ